MLLQRYKEGEDAFTERHRIFFQGNPGAGGHEWNAEGTVSNNNSFFSSILAKIKK